MGQEREGGMNFTPGPWVVDLIDDEFMDAHVYMDHPDETKRRSVCEVLDEDDAYLIAAAPDLLKALEELYALSEIMEDISPISPAQWNFTLEKAIKALKKARGDV